ncbi:MAG TPA: hypothetical protein PLY87_14270, partial [Planctomycetaceae bacterium]|nr:hypothetical protein [Planctomycetaceae bacterium]
DVTPLIVNPAIMPFNLCMSAYYVDGHGSNDGLAPDSDGTQHGPRRTWKPEHRVTQAPHD